jgi:hypothetical protein
MLGQKDTALPELLKAFLAEAEAFGVYADVQNGLNLKHASPTGKPFNMGTIYRNGIVEPGPGGPDRRRRPTARI